MRKKMWQRCHHRVYYCLLGAKGGLRNVSQHGSFLQIGTPACRQDHGGSPHWASQSLGWYQGRHGMRSKEKNLHPMATGYKLLWPHGRPQHAYRESPHPCHPVQPLDLEGIPLSWSTARCTLSSSWGCQEVSFLSSTSSVKDTEFRAGFFLHRRANNHHLGTMRAVRTGEGSRPNCKHGLESPWKERKHSSGKFCPERKTNFIS